MSDKDILASAWGWLPCKGIFVVILMILMAAAIISMTLYPIRVGADAMGQWAQVQSGYLNDIAPPWMVITWKILSDLFPSPASPNRSILYFGLLLFCTGLVLVTTSLIKSNVKAFLVVVLIGTYQPVLIMLGIISKDVLFMASTLLAYGLLLRAQQHHSNISLVLALLMLMFGMGVRYNAITASLPLFIWAGYILIDQFAMRQGSAFLAKRITKTSVSILTGIALSVGAFAAMNAINNMPVRDHWARWPFALTAMFDLANVSVITNHNYFPFLPKTFYWVAQNRYGLEELSQLRICKADPRIAPWSGWTLYPPAFVHVSDPVEYKRLMVAWSEAVTKEPIAYLTNRCSVTKNLYLGLQAEGEYNRSVLATLGNNQSFLFSPCFYLVVDIVCLAILLAKRGSRNLRAHLALGCSSLAYAAAYFFVAFGTDSRYLYWTMVSSVVLSMQLLLDTNWRTISNQILLQFARFRRIVPSLTPSPR